MMHYNSIVLIILYVCAFENSGKRQHNEREDEHQRPVGLTDQGS
jgi:hypothetical protein